MDLSNLKSKTLRKSSKRIGRGGKRGTFSGHGTKGQKSRAGATVRPGFRGGDNRLWQLFPKQRGASHKPGGGGNKRIHKKHRNYQYTQDKSIVFNLGFFNQFSEDEIINPELLNKKGLLENVRGQIKILGDGKVNKKLKFEGMLFSKTALDKVTKAGGTVK